MRGLLVSAPVPALVPLPTLTLVLSLFVVPCMLASNPAFGQTSITTGSQLSSQPSAAQNSTGIKSGERLSQWLLQDRQLQASQSPLSSAGTVRPYALGTAWLTPKEVAAQEAEKQAMLSAFQALPFAKDNPVVQKQRAAFLTLLQNLQATGRVALPSTNPRFLEVNPTIDPILGRNDRVVVPETPSSVTVIRSNATFCKVRYRPNVETHFYVEACKLKDKLAERAADTAYVIEPDGTVHTIGIAAWNRSKQDLPAPGSWIWAPPRWSMWTSSKGEVFSERFASMLAAQGPSGLQTSMDAERSARPSLPTDKPGQLYSVSRDLPISANIWGETGLLQTPSARVAPAGTGSITLGLFQPYGNLNLFFSPTNWMEFGLRYTNINNIPYGEQSLSGGQSYKDKSTGMKVRVIEENAYIPQIAVGVRDLLGTGLFSGEYIVASKRHTNFDFTIGMGWGQLGTRNNITNPFVTAFGQNFATRDAAVVGSGGTANQQYFHGTAALFGGVQYHTPWNNLVLKAEVDGNNYQQMPFGNTLAIKSIFNFGATYQMKNTDFTVGVLGNNQVMFTLSLHERIDLLNTPKLAEAKPVPVELKSVGNYIPNNPSLRIGSDAAIPSSRTTTVAAVTTTATGVTTTATPTAATVATPTNAAVVSTAVNTAVNTEVNTAVNTAVASSTNTTDGTAVNAATPNQIQSSSLAGTQLLKVKQTARYDSTLREFQTQTQWKVKDLQGSGTAWTVHLLDASGVFLRSRINRGVAVLHRDAPSQIETFHIQFYNWGMLVSEVSINRTQWMLENTQLLPPSMRTPTIVAESTTNLPADGGNPFFWSPKPAAVGLAPASNSGVAGDGAATAAGGAGTAATTASTSSTAPSRGLQSTGSQPMLDTLKHKPLQTNLGISYAQLVGGPDTPLLFALGVRADALYKFRENTWVTGTINTRLIDNFGKYNYDPPPTGLQPVRTDIRQYMTQSIATMPNLQLTNTGKLADNHFVSAYAGYLEMMFAGVGGEYLWRPSNSRIAVGADLNQVRQRQFNVWTSMQNYQVTTGHVTSYWDTGVQDILVKLSYGKYLAGDIGGTLDLSRVFQNGVKIGAYATRTNVDYAQFGEGSFDKGLYLTIPFDAFFARHSDSSANLLFTPLIRDGGAKLLRKYQLYDMTRTRDPRALSAGPN
jgi:hypothetical protein